MRQIVIIIQIIVFFSAMIYGQIEYEGTIDEMVNTVQLNDGIMRYYKLDSKTNTVNIYNLDNSLWKSIPLFAPNKQILDDIQLISQDDFNNNELIEIAYTTVWFDFMSDKYESAEAEPAPTYFTFYIVDEKGTNLLEVKGGSGFRILENNGKKKLLIFKIGELPNDGKKNYTDIFTLKD